MVHSTTLSISQRCMLSQLIIEWFGTNVHNIAVVNNILEVVLIILLSVRNNQEDTTTRQAQICTNKLFTTKQDQNHKFFYL